MPGSRLDPASDTYAADRAATLAALDRVGQVTTPSWPPEAHEPVAELAIGRLCEFGLTAS